VSFVLKDTTSVQEIQSIHRIWIIGSRPTVVSTIVEDPKEPQLQCWQQPTKLTDILATVALGNSSIQLCGFLPEDSTALVGSM